MAPLLPTLKRPGRKHLTRSGSRRRGAGCREGGAETCAPAPRSWPPPAPVLGREFSGGWGLKRNLLDTPPFYPQQGGVGRGALPAARDPRGRGGQCGRGRALWAWPSCLPVWAAGPGAAHLLLVPLASEAAVPPARALSLIQAQGTASPGRLDSEAGTARPGTLKTPLSQC